MNEYTLKQIERMIEERTEWILEEVRDTKQLLYYSILFQFIFYLVLAFL